MTVLVLRLGFGVLGLRILLPWIGGGELALKLLKVKAALRCEHRTDFPSGFGKG